MSVPLKCPMANHSRRLPESQRASSRTPKLPELLCPIVTRRSRNSHEPRIAAGTTHPEGRTWPDETHLSAGRFQSFRDVVDRCLLGFADLLAVLPVSGCDFVGQRDDEAAIFFDLFRRGLPLKQSDGITQVLQSVLLELLGRVIPRVIPLRFRRHDVI